MRSLISIEPEKLRHFAAKRRASSARRQVSEAPDSAGHPGPGGVDCLSSSRPGVGWKTGCRTRDDPGPRRIQRDPNRSGPALLTTAGLLVVPERSRQNATGSAIVSGSSPIPGPTKGHQDPWAAAARVSGQTGAAPEAHRVDNEQINLDQVRARWRAES